MTALLTDFEIDELNRFIPTQTFQDMNAMRVAMRNDVRERKDDIIRAGITTEEQFDSFTNHSIDNIARFLLEHMFFHDRDGQVIILTEKGKHLRQQGSFQKYQEWEKERNATRCSMKCIP